MEASSVPHEVLGLAIFVDCLSFIATILGLLLCCMLWSHGERVSYILMLSASTTFGSIVGLVRHIDYTMHWRDIQVQRFKHEQHRAYNPSDMFRKADVGWRLVLSWISIFTYNVDALLVLFWSITLFISTWDIKIKASNKDIMSVVFKASAVVLPVVMCGICSTDAIQETPIAYLVVFNFIMVVCLTSGSIMVMVVILKYLQSRDLFSRFILKSTAKSTASGADTTSSEGTALTQSGTDRWIILRFGIIMVCLLLFETAQITYQIVNYERSRAGSESTTQSPDFSTEQAKVDISQDIAGTLPSIIAFLIFGTTSEMRKKYVGIAKSIGRCATAQRRKYGNEPIRCTMLRSRAESDASFTSFTETFDLEGQEKTNMYGIHVPKELVVTAPAPSEAATAKPVEQSIKPSAKDGARKVSFEDTALNIEPDPATSTLAYSRSTSSRRAPSPQQGPSGSLASTTVAVTTTTDDDPLGARDPRLGPWDSPSRSRQGSLRRARRGSISNNRRTSSSVSRQSSVSSNHSQRSWTSPSSAGPPAPPPMNALPEVPRPWPEHRRPSRDHRYDGGRCHIRGQQTCSQCRPHLYTNIARESRPTMATGSVQTVA